MRIALTSGTALALAIAIGCAANPRPGEPGYPYNVDGVYDARFVVDGTGYQGTTELETSAGGTVRGDFSIERPLSIVGVLSGTVLGDSLAWSGDYTQSTECDGTVSGSGRVSEGGNRVEGPMQVNDSCGGVLEGTFEFSRPGS